MIGCILGPNPLSLSATINSRRPVSCDHPPYNFKRVWVGAHGSDKSPNYPWVSGSSLSYSEFLGLSLAIANLGCIQAQINFIIKYTGLININSIWCNIHKAFFRVLKGLIYRLQSLKLYFLRRLWLKPKSTYWCVRYPCTLSTNWATAKHAIKSHVACCSLLPIYHKYGSRTSFSSDVR